MLVRTHAEQVAGTTILALAWHNTELKIAPTGSTTGVTQWTNNVNNVVFSKNLNTT